MYSYLCLGEVGFYLIPLWVSYYGHTRAARVLSCTILNCNILVYSYAFSTASGLPSCYYFSIALPLLYFDITDLRNIVFGLATSFLPLLAANWFFVRPGIDISADALHIISTLMASTVGGLLMFAIFVFGSSIYRQREELSALNRQMDSRNKELETAYNELNLFSYAVSHDLRAPLRAIAGFSNIILEDYYDKLDAGGQKTIRTIVDNATRMGMLIDDILSFSKLSRMDKAISMLDMNLIFGNTFEELRRDEPTERIIHLDIGQLHQAYGDRVLVGQVVVNLLSNALKYSRKKEVTYICIRSTADGNGFVTYSVKDNGAGFDEKYKDKLFQIFQRLHPEKDFEGTGIGLAIVKKVVERHGGSVWVESKPEAGTVFYFTLPQDNVAQN